MDNIIKFLGINSDLYFWYFSTLAQSIAAIFGVYGMFVVYRLTFINNKIESTDDEFYNYYMRIRIIGHSLGYYDFTAGPRELFTKEEIKNEISEIRSTFAEVSEEDEHKEEAQNIVKFCKEIQDKYDYFIILKDNLKRAAKIPIFAMAIIFIVSIIGLLLSNADISNIYLQISLILSFIGTLMIIITVGFGAYKLFTL